MNDARDPIADALFAGIWIFLLVGSAIAAMAIHDMEQREAHRLACESSAKVGHFPARCLEVR